MDNKQLRRAENALKQIARRERRTLEEIKKDINIGLLVGMLNHNPEVQAYWKRIPHEGDIPTAEEVIVFLSEKMKKRPE